MNIWYGLGVDGGAPRLRCKAAKAVRMPCWTDVCPASLTACLCKALYAIFRYGPMRALLGLEDVKPAGLTLS